MCWSSSDDSSSLLAEDVLGSYLLCPHPKDPSIESLLIRFPSGLVNLAIKTSSNGRLYLEVSFGFINKSMLCVRVRFIISGSRKSGVSNLIHHKEQVWLQDFIPAKQEPKLKVN